MCHQPDPDALDKPKKLRKAALILSSGSDLVYSGAIFEYQNSFLQYLHLEDCGMFAAHGEENQSPELLERLRAAGKKPERLNDTRRKFNGRN